MSSGGEGKDYVVSQAALEKIVRTAASGTTGVAPDKKVCLTVKQKDGAVAVQIQIAALYGSRLRELALAVQHHTAQAVRDMIGPDALTVDVTIDDIVMPREA